MKYLLSLLLLIAIAPTNGFAQQSRKADDALLLDYYQNQHFADALAYLKNIYPEPVTDAKELARLAYVCTKAGKLSDAEGFYQRIYDKDSINKVVLYNIASINQQRGNNTKAELFYKKLITIDSTDFNIYSQLARISHERGSIPNEIYYLQKANKLNPTDGDVAADLSFAYTSLKQFTQAEKVLAIAIAADPESIFLQQSLLRLNEKEEKWRETLKIGEQLLLIADSSASTLATLGKAYYQTRNYQCGIATLLAIPGIYQTETTAYYVAVCYKQLHDQKNAITYLKKAIFLSISPNDGAYYNEMADSYGILNKVKDELAAYQKAQLYDDKPITNYFLAVLYDTKLKDKKNALKYFKKYIAGKPDENQKTYTTYSMARIAALSMK